MDFRKLDPEYGRKAADIDQIRNAIRTSFLIFMAIIQLHPYDLPETITRNFPVDDIALHLLRTANWLFGLCVFRGRHEHRDPEGSCCQGILPQEDGSDHIFGTSRFAFEG